jgi:hypothetical protein
MQANSKLTLKELLLAEQGRTDALFVPQRGEAKRRSVTGIS